MKDKSSGIFASWLQNFATLVFTQSFHAIFLVFVLKMMSAVSADSNDLTNINNGMLAIISIAGSMAIIKLEKLIKQLFGINDSKFMGGLGQNFAKTFSAVASGAQLARRTAEPFKKHKEINKKRDKIIRDIEELNSANKSTDNTNDNPTQGNGGRQNTQSQPIDANISQGTGDAQNTNGKISNLISALDKNTQALNNNQSNGKDSKGESDEDKLAKLNKELDELDAERKVTTRQMFTRTGSTLAAAAFGLGAAEDISGMVNVTNLVDAPLDMISDRAVNKSVYKKKSKIIDDKIDEVRENIRKEYKEKNQGLEIDSSALEAAVKEATKDLQKLKISMDDKIPDTLRKNLADVWKDVQRETPKNTTIRTKSNYKSGSDSVDNL